MLVIYEWIWSIFMYYLFFLAGNMLGHYSQVDVFQWTCDNLWLLWISFLQPWNEKLKAKLQPLWRHMEPQLNSVRRRISMFEKKKE